MSWICIFVYFCSKQLPFHAVLVCHIRGNTFQALQHSFLTRFSKVKCWLHLWLSDMCYRYVTFHKMKTSKKDDVTKYQNRFPKETQNHLGKIFWMQNRILVHRGFKQSFLLLRICSYSTHFQLFIRWQILREI